MVHRGQNFPFLGGGVVNLDRSEGLIVPASETSNRVYFIFAADNRQLVSSFMHGFFPFPLVGGKIESLDSIQDIISIIPSDKIQNISKRNNSKSTSFFVDLKVSAIPLIGISIEDLDITDSFFAFFAPEEVELFIMGDATKFGAVGVERAHLLPVEGEEV